MSRAQAESVIKSIMDDISRSCAAGGQTVPGSLVAFMVKAVMLDPRNGFNVDRTLTREDIQKLKQLCLDRLMNECSPSLDTIKMQVYFDMNYTSRCEILEEIHRVVEVKLSTASRDITDSRVKTKEQVNALYHKIISYILLYSRLGSPTDSKAVLDAKAVLLNVFPQTELGTFMVLPKKDKEQQLTELSMIVTGIQLFNKAKEEESYPVPPVLNETLPVTSRNIQSDLGVTQSLAWKYTAALERLTGPAALPAESDLPTQLLKHALYNTRQHEAFLKLLLADACVCMKHVEDLQTELSSHMKLLKETMKLKMAVLTAKVFPLFKALSKLWDELQDEGDFLNMINTIRLNLQSFVTSEAKIFPATLFDDLLMASQVKTDEQRMAESSDDPIDPAKVKTQQWLFPETTPGFNVLPLQYNRMCGCMLVDSDGLMLPGNPNIGILKHKDKLYVFSSKEAALKFSSCPDSYIAEVMERAKHCPELFKLLGLQPCVSSYSEMQPEESLLLKPTTKCNGSTQTDIHPVEHNIDKTYEWNEWVLRKKAINLIDLRTKVTHSVQTDVSHMRRENATQTWLPKSAGCQSNRASASNTSKPQSYLAGLRGQPAGHAAQVDLTRGVDE